MILIVLAVILLSFVLMIYSMHSSFYRIFENEAKKILVQSKNEPSRIIAESDLKNLPRPVQRYLKYAQVIGKPMIRTVRLKQKGQVRQKPDEKWMPLKADEYFSVSVPSFTWFGKIQTNTLFFISGKDRYFAGKGNMNIKLLSVFSIGNYGGKEIDQGAMTRFMNEIMWFPTAYLSDFIKWEAVDDNSAKMIMNYGGLTESATLYIDNEGKLLKFSCNRYRTAEGKQILTKWETPVSGYGERNGYRIPLKGQGIWKLDSGDFPYIQLEIESIEYDKKELY